jgi:hypothetical protein
MCKACPSEMKLGVSGVSGVSSEAGWSTVLISQVQDSLETDTHSEELQIQRGTCSPEKHLTRESHDFCNALPVIMPYQ